MKDRIKKTILHPLFIALVIFLFVHIFNITRFEFLAEKDSYGWLLKYEENIKYNLVNDYRQLFSTLTISFHYLTGLSLFNIFKYLMPLIFLTSFVPAWLVARKLKNYSSKLLILLSLLGSATVILQAEATRPQIMAMLFLYFSLGLAMISQKEENKNFVAGLIGMTTVIGSLFHRVFVIFLLLWIICFAIKYWKNLQQNKLKVFVLLFLSIPWLEKIEAKNMMLLAFKSVKEIVLKIFIHPEFNFLFPAIYTNIDDRQMGWGSALGVLKYYAFYAGPFFLFLISLTIIFLIFNRPFKKYLFEKLKEKSFLFVSLNLLFFISIAEFFPRIGNIAYLPDRAWVFLGILLILPLYFLLDFSEKNFSQKTNSNIIFLLFLTFIISVSGGIYVNHTMKNIIPKHKMEAYKWIRENLNSENIIFSFGYANALEYHSGFNVLKLKKDVFINNDFNQLIKILNLGNKNQFDRNQYKKNISQTIQKTDEIINMLKNEEFSYSDLSLQTKNLKKITDETWHQISTSTAFNPEKDSFVFFANDSSENPYKERISTGGYFSGLKYENMNIITSHPENFEKVYDNGGTIIWKFIK